MATHRSRKKTRRGLHAVKHAIVTVLLPGTLSTWFVRSRAGFPMPAMHAYGAEELECCWPVAVMAASPRGSGVVLPPIGSERVRSFDREPPRWIDVGEPLASASSDARAASVSAAAPDLAPATVPRKVSSTPQRPGLWRLSDRRISLEALHDYRHDLERGAHNQGRSLWSALAVR